VLHTVKLTFTKQAAPVNTWGWTASIDDGANNPNPNTNLGSLTFDSKGQFSAITGDTITIPAVGGALPATIKLDLTSLTQLAATSDAA
jgi:hypothetical protein